MCAVKKDMWLEFSNNYFKAFLLNIQVYKLAHYSGT